MNAVHKLTPQVTSINSPELTKLHAKLNVLDWWQQGEEISRFCSLHEDELMKKESRIPASSLAGRLGHSTVEDFITKSSSSMGLAMDWNDWQETVHACILKKRYAIHLTDKTQIVSQFNDITSYIGREPFSYEEYHVERDNLFTYLKEEMSANHRASTIELRNQITSIELEKSQIEKQVKQGQAVLAATKDEFEQKMTELTLVHEAQVEKNSVEAIAKFDLEKKNLTSEYENKLSVAQGQYLLDKKTHEQQVTELNAQIANLKATHETEIKEMLSKYIHISDYRQVELSLAKERENHRVKADEMAVLTDESSRLQILNESLSDSLKKYELEAISFKEELEALQTKFITGEITTNDIDAARIQEIEARNGKLEAMRTNYEMKVAELEGLNKQKSIVISGLQKKLKKYKKTIKAYKQMLIQTQQSSMVFKVATSFFVMTTMTLIAIQGMKLIATTM